MNYTTEAKRLAGKKIAVQDGWIIEDGPFKGQNCFYIPNSTVGWIPQCDLIRLKPTSLVKWKEIAKRGDMISAKEWDEDGNLTKDETC